MRKLTRTILRILDGSPSMAMATRQRQRGQSMLEMAFITPLLIILIVGAVEVGWYTNHWLTLLEVTRVGARSATFLEGEFGPLAWNNNASIHPTIQQELMGDTPLPEAYNSRACNYNGFYTFIVCTVISSMDPLTLNIDLVDPLDAGPQSQEDLEAEGVPSYDPLLYDEVVVSVFAVQVVNNVTWAGSEEENEDGTGFRPVYLDMQDPQQVVNPLSDIYRYTMDLDNPPDRYGTLAGTDRGYQKGIQAIVVGRYPANANECTHSDAVTKIAPGEAGYEADPFDYLPDNITNFYTNEDGLPLFIELIGTDGSVLIDSGDEFQRGFIFSGQHRITEPNVYCWGSEFSMRDVEKLMNMPDFIKPDLYNVPTDSAEYEDYLLQLAGSQEQRRHFQSQGLTLVEIFWKHDLMLRFPFFRPILDAFGDNDRIVIALWSAFPLPSAQPNIIYQLP